MPCEDLPVEDLRTPITAAQASARLSPTLSLEARKRRDLESAWAEIRIAVARDRCVTKSAADADTILYVAAQLREAGFTVHHGPVNKHKLMMALTIGMERPCGNLPT